MVKKRKIKTIATKRQETRGGISLFNENDENYKSNIRDKTNSD